MDYKFDSDIWSLGIILLECACGYFPFPPASKEGPKKKSPTFWELAKYYDKMNSQDLYLSEFSPEFNIFVSKCIQIDPSKRFKAIQLLEEPFIKDVNEVQSRELIKGWINTF